MQLGSSGQFFRSFNFDDGWAKEERRNGPSENRRGITFSATTWTSMYRLGFSNLMQVGLADATRTLTRNSTAELGAEIVKPVCQT